MISDKHKDTTFSTPFFHYQYACRWNASLSSEPSEKNRKALSAIPGIKKAFVNLLIETLLAAPKSFRLSGIRLINLDSAEPAQRALSTARIKINKRKTSAKLTSQ